MSLEHKIDDKIIKLISVPLIAVLFSNAGGLIANSRYTTSLLLVQYCYFIFLVYVLWQGNISVVLMVKSRINLEKINYHIYILAILIFTIIYAILIIGFLLKVWTLLFKENRTAWPVLLRSTLILTCIATFITIIYENYLLNRKKLSALSKVEGMSLAKTQAELSVLKSQIDPHFIFNSFNTLSYLISSNPVSAKLYNDTLAKVYQYILINKEKDLVLLREEIEFISNYFYLLRIRFNNAVKMVIEINNLEAEETLIPPISLQTLIENAIKHNEFDDNSPLVISVCVSANQIIVSNRIKHKNLLQSSSKIGLSNLSNRYMLITGRSISIDANQYFTVKLPIINLYV